MSWLPPLAPRERRGLDALRRSDHFIHGPPEGEVLPKTTRVSDAPVAPRLHAVFDDAVVLRTGDYAGRGLAMGGLASLGLAAAFGPEMLVRSMGEDGRLFGYFIGAIVLPIFLLCLPALLLAVRRSLCDPKLLPMVFNWRTQMLHVLQLEWPLGPPRERFRDLLWLVPGLIRHMRRVFEPTPLVLIDCPWSHVQAEYRVHTYHVNADVKMATHSVILVVREPATPQRLLASFLLCQKQISGWSTSQLPELLAHWEYVRRTMCEGEILAQPTEPNFPRGIAETTQFELGYGWLLGIPVTAWSFHYLWHFGIFGGDSWWAVLALCFAPIGAMLVLPMPFAALAYRTAPDVKLPPDVLGVAASGIVPP